MKTFRETVANVTLGGFGSQYAIRPSVRGNNKFHRDSIIKTVADIVGKEHPVNLKNYDKMILVDVCQVGSFRSETLVRYCNETLTIRIEHHWNECCGQ